LATDVNADVGTHKMVLEVTLTDYSIVYDEAFDAVITDCTVRSLSITAPAKTAYDYDLLSTAVALDIPLPTITETPNYCAFGITYEIVLQGTETLPPFMTIVEG